MDDKTLLLKECRRAKMDIKDIFGQLILSFVALVLLVFLNLQISLRK